MDNPNTIERPGGGSPEREKPEKKREESREVRETSKEFVEGVSEVVESVETGEVSEKTGEDKKKGPQGKFPSGGGAAQTKVQLQPLSLPRIEVMQIQIATAIKKEIAVLEKEAVRVSDKPFALSEVVGKIRDLRNILSNLTHLTFEALKGLWMKFVKKG